ncbi:hypothetical protein EDEG_02678 [Edhazardia aedis USNM 41457]|uniref:Transcription factor CBF/NF-Y/archaeal histone domain-containing protein n=1 Tax=Edhazardia aedis (strain USNM 41457) TaxID=1003232 RepID=J8ZTC0_EDHAE|nr:hypothetical protein EDEG_02678 [Edhazardia aedis USNM 41457]|eukprot:EJW02933.1 hypothetical protein EDEG_02678 [Edhazardia aedis USNM 41457]
MRQGANDNNNPNNDKRYNDSHYYNSNALDSSHQNSNYPTEKYIPSNEQHYSNMYEGNSYHDKQYLDAKYLNFYHDPEYKASEYSLNSYIDNEYLHSMPSSAHFQQVQSSSISYDNLRSTDRLLPIANISKIMKAPIPKIAKVAKDAKEIMQKAASEFIAIVTCMAKEICEQENRKTLTGEDLVRAMEQLGMGYYANLARIYMKRYRECGKNMRRRPYDNEEEYNE